MFYAPYYDEYTSLFLCVDENEAYNFDPKRNPEVEQYINSLSAYVGDKNHVSLTFGENNTLRLNVSDEYLAFAEDYGITIRRPILDEERVRRRLYCKAAHGKRILLRLALYV